MVILHTHTHTHSRRPTIHLYSIINFAFGFHELKRSRHSIWHIWVIHQNECHFVYATSVQPICRRLDAQHQCSFVQLLRNNVNDFLKQIWFACLRCDMVDWQKKKSVDLKRKQWKGYFSFENCAPKVNLHACVFYFVLHSE